MSEDELAPPGAGGGPNRMFTYLALGLGIPLVAAIIIGLALVVPRLGGPKATINPAATETAIAGTKLTAVAVARITQQAMTVTSTAPAKTPTPTQMPRPTLPPAPTRAQATSAGNGGATATPVVNGRNPTPMGTQRTPGGPGFVTPTPEGALSPTGVSGETGGPLIILAGFGLLLVLIGARKLRGA